MAENDSSSKKWVLLCFTSLIIVFFGYLFRIIDPFDIWGPLSPYNERKFLLIILSWIILLFCIVTIVNLSIRISENSSWNSKKQIFFLSTFLFTYTIIIGPSLSFFRIWHSDTAVHLYIIKNLVYNNKLVYVNPYTKDFQYTGHFFHRMISVFCVITNINPHTALLFFPQLVMLFFYYTGIFLLIFKCLNCFKDKNHIAFLLAVFFPTSILIIPALTPYGFILSFMPILFYLTYNLTKKNSILLIIILIIAIQTHIFGLFSITVSFVMIFVRKTSNILENVNYKYIFLIIWITYSIGILIISFIILYDVISNFYFLIPFDDLRLILSIYGISPEGILSNLLKSPLISILYNGIWIFVTIFVVICNQLTYISYYRKGVKFRKSKLAHMKFFCDLFFVITLVTFFVGNSVLLYRINAFPMILYNLLSIYYFIKIWEEIHARSKKFKFKYLGSFFEERLFMIVISFIILFFSIYPFEPFSPYTNAQYAAAEWIEANRPEESVFLTSRHLSKFILGMTLRKTTIYCNDYYDHILIDLEDPLLEYYNELIKFPCEKNIFFLLEKLNTNMSYTLIYNQSNIFIYTYARY